LTCRHLQRPAEGIHIVRVETSKNAAGLTGFAKVAVTLSKRAIPVDTEGWDDSDDD